MNVGCGMTDEGSSQYQCTRSIVLRAVLLVLPTLWMLNGHAQDADIRKMREESRKVAAELVQRVQKDLRREMEYGGLSSAISVCKLTIPEIASSLSRRTGWRVTQVSLKPRNAAIGSPDAWEQTVLSDFERRAARGEKFETMERAEIIREPQGTFFRYMKALPIDRECIVCHGPSETLHPTVRRRLEAEYPFDAATGYSIGQVRGAVTVKRRL